MMKVLILKNDFCVIFFEVCCEKTKGTQGANPYKVESVVKSPTVDGIVPSNWLL